MPTNMESCLPAVVSTTKIIRRQKIGQNAAKQHDHPRILERQIHKPQNNKVFRSSASAFSTHLSAASTRWGVSSVLLGLDPGSNYLVTKTIVRSCEKLCERLRMKPGRTRSWLGRSMNDGSSDAGLVTGRIIAMVSQRCGVDDSDRSSLLFCLSAVVPNY